MQKPTYTRKAVFRSLSIRSTIWIIIRVLALIIILPLVLYLIGLLFAYCIWPEYQDWMLILAKLLFGIGLIAAINNCLAIGDSADYIEKRIAWIEKDKQALEARHALQLQNGKTGRFAKAPLEAEISIRDEVIDELRRRLPKKKKDKTWNPLL